MELALREDDDFDFEVEVDNRDELRKRSLGLDSTSESAKRLKPHVTVCRHWLKNLCMKGEKCDFLHQYDPNRMPECFSWLRTGKCGDPECVFKHVENSERPLCHRYKLGFCRYGAMCRSRHDKLPRDAMPELLPDWFLDSLIVNSHLIPRSDDVRLSDLRERLRSVAYQNRDLGSLVPATEQGTIPGLPAPIHGKCRYYSIRSMNVRNIQTSVSKGIWATSQGNSRTLRQAFKDIDHVILVFSATESRSFSGYGKMMCEPDDSIEPGAWGDMSSRLSPSFRVQWIKQCSAPMSHADHIKNPQNEDLPVRRCRDGQELPSEVGERLCRFLWQQGDADPLKGSDVGREPRQRRDAPPPALQDGAAEPGEVAGRRPREEDDLSRPAPVPLGTFQRDRHSGSGPVAVGKALASGSSSLLAAMAEDPHHAGFLPPPGHAPLAGRTAGWRPPPVDHHPPPGYCQPPPAPPGYYAPPPGPRYPPYGYGHPPPGAHYGAPAPGYYPPPPSHGGPPPGWDGPPRVRSRSPSGGRRRGGKKRRR